MTDLERLSSNLLAGHLAALPTLEMYKSELNMNFDRYVAEQRIKESRFHQTTDLRSMKRAKATVIEPLRLTE